MKQIVIKILAASLFLAHTAYAEIDLTSGMDGFNKGNRRAIVERVLLNTSTDSVVVHLASPRGEGYSQGSIFFKETDKMLGMSLHSMIGKLVVITDDGKILGMYNSTK